MDAGTAVSIVIPARDEAATLPHLLGSIARLVRRPHEVIVVDDDSTDDTAAVAAAAGATVVRVDGPPSGWVGKTLACAVGAQRATGSHLLFLDADVTLAVPVLAMLAAEHRDRGGLVSVQPHHTPRRRYEQLSAYFNAMAMMGTGAFSPAPARRDRWPSGRACSPPSTSTSASVATRRSRDQLLEDVALAAGTSRDGLPVVCLAGAEHVQFRMYPGGLRQLVEGWTKNMASGAAAADRAAVVGSVLWVSAHVAVAVSFVQAVTGAALRVRAAAHRGRSRGFVVVAIHLRWVLAPRRIVPWSPRPLPSPSPSPRSSRSSPAPPC